MHFEMVFRRIVMKRSRRLGLLKEIGQTGFVLDAVVGQESKAGISGQVSIY
jgi:hypothetical protein